MRKEADTRSIRIEWTSKTGLRYSKWFPSNQRDKAQEFIGELQEKGLKPKVSRHQREGE